MGYKKCIPAHRFDVGVPAIPLASAGGRERTGGPTGVGPALTM